MERFFTILRYTPVAFALLGFSLMLAERFTEGALSLILSGVLGVAIMKSYKKEK
ncbi:hypothetical protein [Methanooceanicella nereidis]|uniref:hypothetical protein n=1 Tax=Methanooceanicella nereidis TaxID=2052831 RepID=UPI001E52E228|nr:hypothetical protein [Methanocella sp. CWC-04]